MFIRDEIFQHVTIIESDSDYILWFCISKLFLKTDEDLVFGAVYVPPSDSRFNTQDELDMFEVEICNICVLHKFVCLLGDFNARVCKKDDFINADDFFADYFEFDDDVRAFYNVSAILPKLNMNIHRNAQDSICNNEGNILLEICKSNNLFILNGRCGKDKETGAFTFKNTSTIDYCIFSSESLRFVNNFEIRGLDSLYSDGHSVLTTSLNFKNLTKTAPPQSVQTQRQPPKWQSNKKEEFIFNLDDEIINDVDINLQQALENIPNVNNEVVNDFCSKIGNILIESKTKSFENKVFNTGNTNNKRWFGAQCQSARRKYHLAQKINQNNPSPINKQNLKDASRSYKRTMNYHLNKFNNSIQEKLRKLKSNSPKEYWKVINSLERKNEDDKISIDILYNFFKDINENEHNNEQQANDINIDITDDDEILNSWITESEVLRCIKSLKNNKCSGNDNIINEYLKSSVTKMLPIYISFFNLVFETGIIPQSWVEGVIKPIYKRSGDPKEPGNYRPITLLSCFGKLFTAILNQRLNDYLNHNNILNENQAGFRAGYSTVDHIFTLHTITELLKQEKKKLFCLFVDYSKAFASVWRTGLWMKLLGNGINGKIFRVIHNLYQNIKSCVEHAGEQSNFFNSYCGVRQGENLSPILFSLYLNDLEEFLTNSNCSGVKLSMPGNNLDTYLKILTLLYADDTVIFGTDPESFQENINVFFEYSRAWKLNVNLSKTKILIFGIRNTGNLEFKLGERLIDICDEFRYLGIVFSKHRTFYKAIKNNVDHANKALHLLYKRINNLHIPLDLQLDLFDSTVLPILLYGCEIWGFHPTKLIDIVQNQFLRNITKLRKSTPIYMLYAELGRKSLDIHVKSRMIGYWISLVNNDNVNKLSRKIYDIILAAYNRGKHFKWLDSIKQILISVGEPGLFDLNFIENPKATKAKIVQKLNDLYTQEWSAKLQNSSKGRNYSVFKHSPNFEPYLMLPRKVYLPIVKFRTSNYKLPIEVGRWHNVPLNERKCTLCNQNDLGDDMHYLLKCGFFDNERKKFLKPYYYRRPNMIKFKDLLTCNNKIVLAKLSKFMQIIMNKFSNET